MQVTITGYNPTLDQLCMIFHPQGMDEQYAELVWPGIAGHSVPEWVETLMVAHAVRELLIRGATGIKIETGHILRREAEAFLQSVYHLTARQYGIDVATVPMQFCDPITPTSQYAVTPPTRGPMQRRYVSLDWPVAQCAYNMHMLAGASIALETFPSSPGDTCYLHCESPALSDEWHYRGLGNDVPVKALKASSWGLAEWAQLVQSAHALDLNSVMIVTHDTAEANLPVTAPIEDFRHKESELVSPQFIDKNSLPGDEKLVTRDLDYFSSSLFAEEIKRFLASHNQYIEHCSPSSYLTYGTLVDMIAHFELPLVVQQEAELVRLALVARQLGINDEIRLHWMVAGNPVKVHNRYLHALAARMSGLDLFGTYAGLFWSIDNLDPLLRAGPTARCLMLNMNVRQLVPQPLRSMLEKVTVEKLQPYALRIMDTELAQLEWPFQIRLGVHAQSDATLPPSYFAVEKVLDITMEPLWMEQLLLKGEAQEETIPVFGLSTLRALRDGYPMASLRIPASTNALITSKFTRGIPSFQTYSDGEYGPLGEAWDQHWSHHLDGENFYDLAPLVNYAICLGERNLFPWNVEEPVPKINPE